MIEIKDFKEDFEYPDAKAVDFEGKDLFVKQYLPAEQKYQFIDRMITVMGVNEHSLKPLLSDILFNVYIVEFYSNIILADEDHSEIFKTYDILNTKGIIDLVIENIPAKEYQEVCHFYDETLKETIKYNQSFACLLRNVIEGVSSFMTDAEESIEGFDPEKYEAISGIIKKLSDEKHI